MGCSIIRGVVEASRCEGARPCPPSHHTSSSRSGNSFAPCCSLPESKVDHPLGSATGPAYTRLRGLREAASDTALRVRLPEDRGRDVLGEHAAPQARRADMGAGLMDALEDMALGAYDRAIGLDLSDVAVDRAASRRLRAAARRRARARWTG